MLPVVASAEEWTDGPPETALHVALTYAGLAAIGLPEEMLASFPEAFRDGMAARAARLGDRGPSAPEHWEPGLGTGEAHVLVTVYAVDSEKLETARMALKTVGAEGAVTVINEQRAEALDGGEDHFGFFDGIAQPAIDGGGVAGRPGDGQPTRNGWRDVAPGEFLLGHKDEDGDLPDAPVAPFDKNATFMVYRKLAMDVAAFRRCMAEHGEKYPGGPEQLAAKVVGRWKDGTPLSVSPDAPDPALASDTTRINDFKYADDPAGLKCPLGAHIRRANPRDGLFGGSERTRRHRIIRRGMPYGPPLPEDARENGHDERGLMFVCFNASITRQFETVNGWLRDGDTFGIRGEADPLTTGAEGWMSVQGNPPTFVTLREPLVQTRGGEYLFVPGLTALGALAEPLAGAPLRVVGGGRPA
jgi:Dyp-type peroxidase family